MIDKKNKKCLFTLIIAIVLIVLGLVLLALDLKKSSIIFNTLGGLLAVYTVFCAVKKEENVN
jgi:predicted membrane protein